MGKLENCQRSYSVIGTEEKISQGILKCKKLKEFLRIALFLTVFFNAKLLILFRIWNVQGMRVKMSGNFHSSVRGVKEFYKGNQLVTLIDSDHSDRAIGWCYDDVL